MTVAENIFLYFQLDWRRNKIRNAYQKPRCFLANYLLIVYNTQNVVLKIISIRVHTKTKKSIRLFLCFTILISVYSLRKKINSLKTVACWKFFWDHFKRFWDDLAGSRHTGLIGTLEIGWRRSRFKTIGYCDWLIFQSE